MCNHNAPETAPPLACSTKLRPVQRGYCLAGWEYSNPPCSDYFFLSLCFSVLVRLCMCTFLWHWKFFFYAVLTVEWYRGSVLRVDWNALVCYGWGNRRSEKSCCVCNHSAPETALPLACSTKLSPVQGGYCLAKWQFLNPRVVIISFCLSVLYMHIFCDILKFPFYAALIVE